MALSAPFVFRERPAPIPPELRPEWRIATLVLSLHTCCRDSKSSLTRLHLLNSAVRTQESRLRLLTALKGFGRPDVVVGRFDPSLDRAVGYAAAEGYLKLAPGKRIELTSQGVDLAKGLRAEPSLLVNEKAFFDELKHRVSEALSTRLMRGETK